jgi:DNA replication protein DnaD
MKIKFVLGPYGYEVVIGNLSEEIYNKYSQDYDSLRDAVTGFSDDSDLKEWSEMDDIAHNYGAVLEEEATDQYLKVFNENNDELLNIPLTLDKIKSEGFNIKEDIKHSLDEDLSEKFYFFGQSGEKGEWENLDQLFEQIEFKPSEFNIHIANLDGLKIVYGISHKINEKVLLSVESSNPNFQNFEVRMGDDV